EGERLGLGDVEAADEATVDDPGDRLADVVDVDGLERLLAATEHRQHVRAEHRVAHLLEESLPLAREDQAGADDRVAAVVDERLDRVLALPVVARRIRRGDDARDEDGPTHAGAAGGVEQAASAVLGLAPDAVE